MNCLTVVIALTISVLCGSVTSCDRSANAPDKATHDKNNRMSAHKIKITIHSKTFTATLADNSAAKAFYELLPLSVSMIELNGNEKYYDLSKDLPSDPFNPGTIRDGALMLYGSKTVVLFYKTFSTAYSYTRLGSIDAPSGLASALGAGNVTVSFEKDP